MDRTFLTHNLTVQTPSMKDMIKSAFKDEYGIELSELSDENNTRLYVKDSLDTTEIIEYSAFIRGVEKGVLQELNKIKRNSKLNSQEVE